jgi:hypothetical protein
LTADQISDSNSRTQEKLFTGQNIGKSMIIPNSKQQPSFPNNSPIDPHPETAYIIPNTKNPKKNQYNIIFLINNKNSNKS